MAPSQACELRGRDGTTCSDPGLQEVAIRPLLLCEGLLGGSSPRDARGPASSTSGGSRFETIQQSRPGRPCHGRDPGLSRSFAGPERNLVGRDGLGHHAWPVARVRRDLRPPERALPAVRRLQREQLRALHPLQRRVGAVGSRCAHVDPHRHLGPGPGRAAQPAMGLRRRPQPRADLRRLRPASPGRSLRLSQRRVGVVARRHAPLDRTVPLRTGAEWPARGRRGL